MNSVNAVTLDSLYIENLHRTATDAVLKLHTAVFFFYFFKICSEKTAESWVYLNLRFKNCSEVRVAVPQKASK